MADLEMPKAQRSEIWTRGTEEVLAFRVDLSLQPQVAITQWGHPTAQTDLTSLFLTFLHKESPTTPFSPTPLSAESESILPQLVALTSQGLWTVASQPAVDGALSSDSVVGWGPRGGRVFQKAFVEFFCEEERVGRLVRAVEEFGEGWVTYFAGNNERTKDGFETNVADDGGNAVTWGVFPGQEIAQPTIIDRDSFLAWKDDAFMIWNDFGLCYPPDSPPRKLIEEVTRSKWLVSIVHHDYKDADALWNFLAKHLNA
ncbi:hypothetical protein FRC10_002361 [Ceratobasidium sp. 414]|nr:hypothetical protein FRC10_002361 [Ceratobasidium sp. 414]